MNDPIIARDVCLLLHSDSEGRDRQCYFLDIEVADSADVIAGKVIDALNFEFSRGWQAAWGEEGFYVSEMYRPLNPDDLVRRKPKPRTTAARQMEDPFDAMMIDPTEHWRVNWPLTRQVLEVIWRDRIDLPDSER